MPKSKEFISSSDSDSDGGKPKAKKQKKEKKEKPKASRSADNDEETMFQLSRMRFVNVTEFRGKILVNIREYYEADGDLKPGKKGISLTLEQWQKLKDHMADIDERVKEMS